MNLTKTPEPQIITQQEVVIKSAPAAISTFNNILCVSNLEVYLSKFSLILDSMLLLRLLLHKLSWDLSLVAKKRQQVKNYYCEQFLLIINGIFRRVLIVVLLMVACEHIISKIGLIQVVV